MRTIGFVLCIDPGHGNGNIKKGVYDPGACAANHTEADIVLQYALAIKYVGIHEFDIQPARIVLTRDDREDYLPVWNRDDIAKARGATHFLSLHMNAAGPTANGTETFYPDRKGAADDRRWAELVQNIALKALGLRNRGIKKESSTRHKRLAVFGGYQSMSTCLLEIGFITNLHDRTKILTREARLEFARTFWKEFLASV